MSHKYRHTIKSRFIIMILALILFLGIGISTLFYYLYMYSLNKTMLQNTETNIHFMADNINYNIDNIIKYSQWCRSNTDINNFLITPRSNDNYGQITSKATNVFNADFLKNSSRNYIQRIVIGSLDKDDYLQIVPNSYSKDCNMPALIKALPYFNNYINYNPISKYNFILENSSFPCANQQMVPLIQTVESTFGIDNIGFIYTEISIQLFKDAIKAYSQEELSNVYITIGSNTYQLSNSTTLKQITNFSDYHDISSDDLLYSNTKYRSVYNGKENIQLVSLQLSMSGCYITEELSPAVFKQWHNQYIIIIIMLVIIILIVGALLLFSFARFFNKPVRKIHHQINEISNGNFEPDHSIEWNNELGDIGHYINKLGIDINDLMLKRIENECEKKDYEYKMLQSQINPHFLYNTLNSIKWMATIQKSDGIAEMTTSLSRLLKNISKGKSGIVSIDYELALLSDYLTIQKYRYGGALNVEYIIDDEMLRNNQILRFTLQPVIENAIFHGIEPKGNTGHITVHIYDTDDKSTKISITDDGIGMTPELIENVLNDDSANDSSFFKNMGISSVNKMIKYTFGDNYGMSIESELGLYTTVHILLPKKQYEGGGIT
ncbi:sensor histidine kinase [[Clostridium] fimetarium]|uniref:Two-component system, sensor histidine kinase YesM n=1 Tax=[Clostridium] fimetarium TaxID=99656 RepID=A0A1I0NMV4_9FIRM|nr:histidine kinase [[Clostridium] fimetarium]SEW02798.1 two-component system, sensor histidine kinase YesM [[Clostridium] fimetarium]